MTVYELLTIRIESYEDAAHILKSETTVLDIITGMKDARENLTIEAAQCVVL